MEYTVQLNEENNIISAIATGTWQAETDNDMVKEIMEMVKSKQALKVLLDVRELQFAHSIIEVFQRAQELREKRKALKTNHKVAIIYSADLPVDMPFFETASQNRGLPYRVFTEIDEAKEWLLQTS